MYVTPGEDCQRRSVAMKRHSEAAWRMQGNDRQTDGAESESRGPQSTHGDVLASPGVVVNCQRRSVAMKRHSEAAWRMQGKVKK